MDGVWTHSRGFGALRPCIKMSCPQLPVIADANIVRIRNTQNGINSVGVKVRNLAPMWLLCESSGVKVW